MDAGAVAIGVQLSKTVLSWAWDKIQTNVLADADEEIIQLAKDVATDTVRDQAKHAAAKSKKELWQRFSWQRSAEKYAARVLDNVSTTKLLGNPRPVRLTQIYTDVHVFDRDNAYRFSEIDQTSVDRPQVHEDRYPRRRAIEVAKTGHHLYLLGRPGSGKTTFLKHLAVAACKGEIARTPVFISLRDAFAMLPARNLVDLVVEEFSNCDIPIAAKFVEHLLREGRILLLFDGLDEVSEEGGLRRGLISQLETFAKKYPASQICVSCRIAATEYSFEHFDYLEIADFSAEQKITFINKWFEDDGRRRAAFLAQWSNTDFEGVRELGRTPLLLALTCLAFEQNLEIPRRRVDLYKDAIEALLKKWDVSRNILRDPPKHRVEPNRYEHLFLELGGLTFKQNAIVFSPELAGEIVAEWYEKTPEGRHIELSDAIEILGDIEARTGLIVTRGKRTLSFSHLTIQEFFAARAIVCGRLYPAIWTFVTTRLLSTNWREVFLFCAGLVPEGTSFINSMVSECNRILRLSPAWVAKLNVVRAAYDKLTADRRRGESLPLAHYFQGQVAPKVDAAQSGTVTLQQLHLLRRAHELVKTQGVPDLEAYVVVLHNVLHTYPHVVGGSFDIEAADGADHFMRRIRFLDYLTAVVLTIECANATACKDRGDMLRRLFFQETGHPK